MLDKGLKSLQHHSSKMSILQHSAFFMVQLSWPYMISGKTIHTHTHMKHSYICNCKVANSSIFTVSLPTLPISRCLLTHLITNYYLGDGKFTQFFPSKSQWILERCQVTIGSLVLWFLLLLCPFGTLTNLLPWIDWRCQFLTDYFQQY